MSEFFSNIGNWFIENKDTILLWLQGLCTSGTIGVIINLVLTGRKVKNNTTLSADLLNALPIVGESKNAISALIERITTLESDNKSLQDTNTLRYTEIQNSVDSLLNKINALVETESIKSQTIKDETLRTTVGNVLTNAKYNETQTRTKLLETIASLQKKLEQKNNADNEEIKQALAAAQSLIQPAADTTHTVVPRG